jgi:hypothetical protein
VDFLTEDQDLTVEARAQARRALDSALECARVVSTFRQSLGCPSATRAREQDPAAIDVDRPASVYDDPWHYDAGTHTIRARSGAPVAGLSSMPSQFLEARTGRLVAEAPALLDIATETQQVAATLLAGPCRAQAEAAGLGELLERINAVSRRVYFDSRPARSGL